MVHEALNESGYRLDIEKLYRDFQSMDNKRETLSKAQVIDEQRIWLLLEYYAKILFIKSQMNNLFKTNVLIVYLNNYSV